MQYDSEGNLHSSSWIDAYTVVPLGLLSWQERLRKLITREARLMRLSDNSERIWL